MSVVSRADAYQRRHPVIGYPLAVVYKFFEDQGAYLAAIMTYYGFLSLVPSLLLLWTVLGYVLAGDPGAQQAVLNSAFSQVPVIGEELGTPERLGGGGSGLAIGITGAVYGALGVGLALQNAVNVAWAIPRNDRPNPVKSRLRAALLVITAGVFVVGTAVLSAVSSDVVGALGDVLRLPRGASSWLARIATAALAVIGFLFAFRLAAAHRPSFRTVLPSSVAMGLLWQLLQGLGKNLVGEIQARTSISNQVFTAVLGLIAFLFITSCAVVLCVEAEVVRVRRLYPRALLTPLTDSVLLTDADRRTYRGLAQAQRHKGFEEVQVRFGKSPLELAREEAAPPGAPAPGAPSPAAGEPQSSAETSS